MLQKNRVDMPFKVVDSADRDAVPYVEAESETNANQERTGETWAVGYGDKANVFNRERSLFEDAGGEMVNFFKMSA
jgi:hypothetical protein